jgi:hypothetical protein
MFYRKLNILFAILIICLLSGMQENFANKEPVEYPIEKVLLQTDRDLFISGDYLHFKTWLLSEVDNPGFRSGIVYLILRNQWGIIQDLSLQLQQNKADGNLYLNDTLSTGFYELVAFTNWMRNAGEEGFARKTIFVANRFDRNLTGIDEPSHYDFGNEYSIPQILVNGIKDDIGKREKVQFGIKLNASINTNANVSVAVVSSESLARFNGSSDRERLQTNRVGIAGDVPCYYMETDEMVISGVITDSDSGQPVEGARIILNTPATKVNLLYTSSGQDGVFHFAIPSGYMGRDLFLSVDSSTVMGSCNISIINNSGLDHLKMPGNFPLSETQIEYIRTSQDIAKARIAYESGFMVFTEEPDVNNSSLTELYSNPDQVIYLDNFTPFDDLQEIAREIVPAWRIRQSQNVYRSRLINATTGSFLPDEPVYFIDGIICHDLNPLVHLNSEMIERIELQNRNWVHGDLEFPGIISIFTKNQEYLRILAQMPVFQTSQQFYLGTNVFQAPEYTSGDDTDPEKPDLRHMLFWEPDLNLVQGEGAELGFYTGDIGGEYSIVITGVTDSGEIVESVHSFIVK